MENPDCRTLRQLFIKDFVDNGQELKYQGWIKQRGLECALEEISRHKYELSDISLKNSRLKKANDEQYRIIQRQKNHIERRECDLSKSNLAKHLGLEFAIEEIGKLEQEVAKLKAELSVEKTYLAR